MDLCNTCRRLRKHLTTFIFVVAFPITVPLLFFEFFGPSFARKITCEERSFINEDMVEARQRLRKEIADFEARRMRRWRWLTLGLLPKKIIKCLL